MTEFDDAALIVVGGGSGSRFGGENKLLVRFDGAPLFIHALRRLGPCFPAGRRILVVPAAAEARFAAALAEFLPAYLFRLVHGGAARGDSVRAGLAAVPAACRFVAIHDAARPFAAPELLAQVLAAAREHGGAVPGRPVTDTLKRVDADRLIERTVPREHLYAVETPQCFDLEKLRAAYRAAGGDSFTDDAAVMEQAGYPVALVPHGGDNPKITYPADLARLSP